MVNGVGPLLVIFDPGGDEVYTSYERKRLSAGTRQSVCLSAACFFVALHYLDGDPNNLDPRHDARNGVIAGSLGQCLLSNYVATIDYRKLQLTLTQRSEFKPPAASVRSPLTFDEYGLPVIAGTVDGIAGVRGRRSGSDLHAVSAISCENRDGKTVRFRTSRATLDDVRCSCHRAECRSADSN